MILEDVFLELLQLCVEDPDNHVRSVCGLLTRIDAVLYFRPFSGCCEGGEEVWPAIFANDCHAILECRYQFLHYLITPILSWRKLCDKIKQYYRDI